MTDKAKIGNFDQILGSYVGGHGKYQILVTIGAALIYHFANGIFLIHVFTAYAPPHRCRVSECETINITKVRIIKTISFSINSNGKDIGPTKLLNATFKDLDVDNCQILKYQPSVKSRVIYQHLIPLIMYKY